MGSGQSRPGSRQITRQQLISMTQKPSLLINEMFDAMLKKLTPKDLLSLANPQQCQKYVFFMADAIKATFHSLRIGAKKDSQGRVLFYESKDKLTGKDSQEFHNYCLYVAYFYIRIFQTFGALALTVVDDPAAGYGLGVTTAAVGIARPVGTTKGTVGARPSVPPRKWFGGSLADGALKSYNLERFNILEKYISLDEQDLNKYVFHFDGNSNLHITLKPRDSIATLELEVGGEGNIRKIQAVLRYVGERSSLSDLTKKIKEYSLESFKVQTTSDSMFRRQAISTIALKVVEAEDGDWYFSDGRREISDTNRIDNLLIRTLDKVKNQLQKKPDYSVGAAGVAVPLPGSSQFQITPLRTDYIEKALQNKQLTSFCVARAMQLLNADAMISKKAIGSSTHVCSPDGYSMIPGAGRSLSESPGLLSLSTLYYDAEKLEKKEQWVFRFEHKAPQEFAAFIKDLHDTFAKSTPNKKEMTLSDLKMDKPGCESKGKVLKLDPKQVSQVLPHVNRLFGFQAAHTQKVIQFIINNIIFVDKSKGINDYWIHPKLINGGINGLNEVIQGARKLLLEYYKNCEKIYQDGYLIAQNGTP